MGLLEKMRLDIEENAKLEKERQEKAKIDAAALVEALKVAEVKETLKVNAFKKCEGSGKAAVIADGKVEEAEDDVDLAKETLKIAVAKRIEAIKKCVDMEVATKEVDDTGAFIMEKVLNAEEVEAISVGVKASTTKVAKKGTGTKGTRKDEILDAIKGGMITKKALEETFGDIHSQIYQLRKDGELSKEGKGVYSVV